MNIGFRKLSSLKTTIYVSFGLLTIVTGYCAWYANYYHSGNADDIVYPYLFKHFKFHDIILPSQHANILKFPLFIAQSILPYNFTTFTLVNMTLVFVTILAWAALLVWIFGRRYAPIICLCLVSILLGSGLLNNDLLGTTIRNIEYPITLAFIIYTGTLLQRRKNSRIEFAAGVILGVLYALTVAGDSFFLYTIPTAILLSIALLRFGALPAEQKRYRYYVAAAYVVVCMGAGIIIRKAVAVLGIAHYYTYPGFLPHTLALNHLAPSISTATVQVLNLFGANIFGQNIALTNSLVFLNFLLLIFGLAGLIYAIRDIFSPLRRKKLLGSMDFSRTFTLGVTALSPFIILCVYIISDLAVSQTPSGAIVSANQERYLTMLPLLGVTGIAYILRQKCSKQQALALVLPIVILLFILVNARGIHHIHKNDTSLRVGPIAVAQAMQANHIPLLVTGYWHASPSRFWSHNRLAYATVALCNIPNPTFNTRLSWYTPDPAVHSSALLVTRTGMDASYSTCPDQMLTKIYGKPQRIIHVNSPNSPQLWVYNYDIRSKLTPLVY